MGVPRILHVDVQLPIFTRVILELFLVVLGNFTYSEPEVVARGNITDITRWFRPCLAGVINPASPYGHIQSVNLRFTAQFSRFLILPNLYRVHTLSYQEHVKHEIYLINRSFTESTVILC